MLSLDAFSSSNTEVKTLIDISWLKLKAEEAGVIKICVSMHVGKFIFKGIESFKDGRVLNKVKSFKDKVTLTFEENPVLTFLSETGKPSEYLKNMTDFLTF